WRGTMPAAALGCGRRPARCSRAPSACTANPSSRAGRRPGSRSGIRRPTCWKPSGRCWSSSRCRAWTPARWRPRSRTARCSWRVCARCRPNSAAPRSTAWSCRKGGSSAACRCRPGATAPPSGAPSPRAACWSGSTRPP
ncbi:MAG: hypothetical protein AVDCRST_MAG08-1666, partial [uncultured Acetobacteraceae bacterium]